MGICMQSKFVDKKKEHSWGCSLPGSESKCTYSKHKLKTCHITTNVVSCMDSQASKPACKVVLHSQCTMQDGWMDGWIVDRTQPIFIVFLSHNQPGWWLASLDWNCWLTPVLVMSMEPGTPVSGPVLTKSNPILKISSNFWFNSQAHFGPGSNFLRNQFGVI